MPGMGTPWVSGKVGGAILLDGSNDYLAIKDLNYSNPGKCQPYPLRLIKPAGSEGAILSYDRSEYWRLLVVRMIMEIVLASRSVRLFRWYCRYLWQQDGKQ